MIFNLISTYGTLGKIETQTKRLLDMAVDRHDDVLFAIAVRLRELHCEMYEALNAERTARIENQLTALLKMRTFYS